MRYGLCFTLALGVLGLGCGDDTSGTTDTSAGTSGSPTTTDTPTTESPSTSATMSASGSETGSTGETGDTSSSSGTPGSDSSSGESGSSGSSGGSGSTTGEPTGTTEACVPAVDNATPIGQDCIAEDCPDGFDCIPFEGFQHEERCGVYCEADCECPGATTCTMVTDKYNTWYECL